jgi:predicted Zn-dependent protease
MDAAPPFVICRRPGWRARSSKRERTILARSSRTRAAGSSFAGLEHEGWLIENGSLTHPIAPSFLVSDVASLLDAIDAVGSDLTYDHGATNCVRAFQQLPVIVGQPTIRIGLIKVISP